MRLSAQRRGKWTLFSRAGAYPHFVPAVVDSILQRASSIRLHAVPAEVSQDLQAIFEFQTLVPSLFDL